MKLSPRDNEGLLLQTEICACVLGLGGKLFPVLLPPALWQLNCHVLLLGPSALLSAVAKSYSSFKSLLVSHLTEELHDSKTGFAPLAQLPHGSLNFFPNTVCVPKFTSKSISRDSVD